MLIHDFDFFRWILEEEAISIQATGSCLVDPVIGQAGDADTTAVTTRRAAYGYAQRFEVLGSAGMPQAGNPRPAEVTCLTTGSGRRHSRHNPRGKDLAARPLKIPSFSALHTVSFDL